MSKRDAYYLDAQSLFVCENKTLREITKLIPVSGHTLSNWKIEGNWDEKRKDFCATNEGVIPDILKQLSELVREIKERGYRAGDAKELVMLVNAISKLRDGRDIRGSAVAVMKRFAQFAHDRYPERTEDFAGIIREFMSSLERD